jgi:ketosteroid isomerase-like protein
MIGALLAKRKVPAWFDAMNRHDLDALLKGYADDVTLVYPGDVVGVSGRFTGRDAVRAWYQRYFEQFPVVHQTVKAIGVSNILDLVGNNVIAVQWEAEVVNRAGLRVCNDGVSIVTARLGKATHIQVYMSATGDKFRAAWGVSDSVEGQSRQGT